MNPGEETKQLDHVPQILFIAWSWFTCQIGDHVKAKEELENYQKKYGPSAPPQLASALLDALTNAEDRQQQQQKHRPKSGNTKNRANVHIVETRPILTLVLRANEDEEAHALP